MDEKKSENDGKRAIHARRVNDESKRKLIVGSWNVYVDSPRTNAKE